MSRRQFRTGVAGLSFRSSPGFVDSRPSLTTAQRRHIHGPIEPMDYGSSPLRYLVSRGILVVIPILVVVAANALWWAR